MARGAVAHYTTDVWLGASTDGNPQWGMWPFGHAWSARHFWERYLYSGDREFLERRAFPALRDAALFIVDWPVAWATGIGDRLHPAVPLTGYRILLVNPGFSVPTARVYEKFALTAAAKKINLKNLLLENGIIYDVKAILPKELVNGRL
jgi:hypothetical protein